MKVGYDGLNYNLSRRYFILNFNKTTTIDGKEYETEVFEIDMRSFCILICEICSDKQDIEDNICTQDVRKYLIHGDFYFKEKTGIVQLLE